MKEKALSLALGLSRDLLKELRSSYEEGLHWSRIESRKPQTLWEVEWTDAGVAKVKENIKTASYGIVIVVGLGVTGVVVYTVFSVSV